MNERTIMAVVTDLVKSGLSVEQTILVNELALAVASAQHSNDERARWRESKRVQRQSSDSPKTPPSSPPMINNSTPSPTPDLAKAKSIKPLPDEPLFEGFWEVYPRKVGKGAARKAYRNALKRASHVEILVGAKSYAASKPDPKYTPHAATWLNADRWLDEPDKKPQANVVGFRKEFRPEPERPKISEEERQRNLAKLTNLVSSTLKWSGR
jgi:hypothetical protein